MKSRNIPDMLPSFCFSMMAAKIPLHGLHAPPFLVFRTVDLRQGPAHVHRRQLRYLLASDGPHGEAAALEGRMRLEVGSPAEAAAHRVVNHRFAGDGADGGCSCSLNVGEVGRGARRMKPS